MSSRAGKGPGVALNDHMPHRAAVACDAARLYPTRLVFARKGGFTFWGGNIDGSVDYFMQREDQKIPLYSSLKHLADSGVFPATDPFVRLDHYLSFRTTFRNAFRSDVVSPRPVEEDEVATIDFADAVLQVSKAARTQPFSTSNVLDCLNAATDFAKQTGDQAALDLLLDEEAPLNHLYSFIWDERSAVDFVAVHRDLIVVTTWFESMTRIVEE